MARKADEMTALAVSKLKTPGYHSVGGVPGLTLQVTATGARTWILRATVGSRRREMGLGGYETLTLAKARDKARECHALIREGIDPVEAERAKRSALKAANAKAKLLRPSAPEKEDPNIAAALAAASGKTAPTSLSDRLAALKAKQG